MTLRRLLVAMLVLAALVVITTAVSANVDRRAPADGPWQALTSPPGGAITALAASPAFAIDHVLFAGTSGGLFRSDDAGQHWSPLGIGPTGVISGTLKIVPSPAYPTDHTLFVLTRTAEPPGRRVLRSTDAGATWQAIWESDAVHDLVVSPNYAADGTLFLGGAQFGQPQVYRSTDRGDTWLPTAGQPANLDVYLLAISPHFAADHTLFAAGYGPLHRSTDGGASWQQLSAAGPNYSLAISPHFAADHTLWAMYREIEGSAVQPEAGIIRSTDGGATWSNVTAGLDGNYNENYRSLAPDPAGEAIYLALSGPQWDARFPPRVYRSDNGGLRWAPQELLPGGAAPQQVLPLGPLPDLFVLAEGVAYRYTTTCYEAVADGSIEADPSLLAYPAIARAWTILDTPLDAGYAEDLRHDGAYAMRTGTGPSGPNIYSYSSAQQWLAIPADAIEATLTFWRHPTFGDAVGKAAVDPATVLAAGPDETDFQYLVAVYEDGSYDTVRIWHDNSQTWTLTTVDLRAYAGRSFNLRFGTFNNGTGGRSSMVFDQVSVRICRPAPQRAGRGFLPLILRQRAAPPTATPTPTPTPTTTPTGFPAYVRELVVAPGEPGPLYALTNSELLLVSYDRGESWQTAPQGVPPAVGRAGLGMDYANPSTLYLGTQGGLFRTNASGQWQFWHTVRTHALSVEYGRPTTLWAAPNPGHDFGSGVMIIKSDDGGQTWRAASGDLSGWSAANPIIIDPDDPNTLFVTTSGKYGGGSLYRGTNAGNWRWLPVPTFSYYVNTGLAFDNGANALYMGSRSPGRLWRSTNANTLNPNDVAWQLVHDFGMDTSVVPLAVGWGPQGAALYINLTDTRDWSTRLLRSDDDGRTWHTLSLPPGPPPPPSNQYQLVVNGYPATRLIADHRTPDRYATSFAGLHRKIGYGDWVLVNNAAPRPKFVYSPANSSLIWVGLTPLCLAGGPDEPMYKSSDGGRAWIELPAGRNLQPVVAHPTDPFKVYAFGCDGVYLTRDGGATWQHQDSDLWRLYFVSDIAPVDPNWTTVFAGGVSEGGGGMVARSQDGGQTWTQVTPLGEDIWWVTDVWVDPINPSRVYFVEPKGVWRSLDGGNTWQRFTAGLEDVLYQDGREDYGLLEIQSRLDDPSHLYLGTAAGLYESLDYGAHWRKLSGYSWDHQPVDGLLAEGYGVWLNSPDGAFYLFQGYPTATPAATATPTATPTATAAPGGCWEGITNGGFETDAAWIIRDNPVPAAYVTSPVHSGSRSMRTGIAQGGTNVASYSPIEQAPPMPGSWQSILRFWRYNVWGDGTGQGAAAAPLDVSKLPKTLDELYNTPLATDYFYVIAIKPDNSLVWLMTERVNNPSWRQATLDLSSLSGIPIRLQFGTYNNGTGGISRTFVDDVSLTHCPPTPTATPTASPTFTATATRAATPTPTPTSAGPTATPSPTATRTPIPTATPGFTPTPYWSGQLNLPAGSRPHGVAVSEDGRRVYVAFHGVDHSGRTLGVVNEYLSLQAQIDLGPAAQGPNGVALIPGTNRVVTANRQTANATVVDVAAGVAVQNIAANLLPDGVIVHGGYGYIANYGNDTVTVFDPATLAVIRTLHGVGHEPALFAADPVSNDVYLSAHGSNQVFVLRDGQVAWHWDNIPEPYGLSYDPASRRLYVANRGAHHTVTVIDIYHDWVVGTIELPKEPFVLLVNPDSGHLFVAMGDYVLVYNTLDWSHVTSIPVPPGAEEGIAFDPRLSKVFVTSRDSDVLTVIQDQGPAQVVFASDRDGNGEIYRMLPDGRNQVRLTFTADAWETSPAGSPSGRWIAYERVGDGSPTYRQIWLMSRDGRGAFMATDGPFNNESPSWSADSTQIAIASDRDGDWEIYVLDLATMGLIKLTNNTWDDLYPNWSKISGRIAYTSCRTPSTCELFSMAADGSDVRQLTAGFNDSGPTWSPLADRIAFYGSRPEGQALYTMRSDGANVTQFVPQSLRPASPAWGFVGDTIVFSGYRPGSGYSEIMRVEADGSGLVLLTNNEVNFDYAPNWLAGW